MFSMAIGSVEVVKKQGAEGARHPTRQFRDPRDHVQLPPIPPAAPDCGCVTRGPCVHTQDGWIEALPFTHELMLKQLCNAHTLEYQRSYPAPY